MEVPWSPSVVTETGWEWGDAESVESTQMLVDFLGPDEETKSGQVFAQSFTRRIYLWLKKGAEATRSILEGKKAVYSGIPFAGRRCKLSNGLAGYPCGVQCPFDQVDMSLVPTTKWSIQCGAQRGLSSAISFPPIINRNRTNLRTLHKPK